MSLQWIDPQSLTFQARTTSPHPLPRSNSDFCLYITSDQFLHVVTFIFLSWTMCTLRLSIDGMKALTMPAVSFSTCVKIVPAQTVAMSTRSLHWPLTLARNLWTLLTLGLQTLQGHLWLTSGSTPPSGKNLKWNIFTFFPSIKYQSALSFPLACARGISV